MKNGFLLGLLSIIIFIPISAWAHELPLTPETGHIWNLEKSNEIPIKIIAPNSITKEQISIVEEAIFSEKTYLKNGLRFYHGWNEGLKISTTLQSKILLPQLVVYDSVPTSALFITLSNSNDRSGYNGYTKLTIENNEIIKVEITIYNLDELAPEQLGTITRHELGHALGLPHSSKHNDLMHEKINLENQFISHYNLVKILELYYK